MNLNEFRRRVQGKPTPQHHQHGAGDDKPRNGTGQHSESADRGRAESEGGFVNGTFPSKRRFEDPRLHGGICRTHGAPTNSRHRANLRKEKPR